MGNWAFSGGSIVYGPVVGYVVVSDECTEFNVSFDNRGRFIAHKLHIDLMRGGRFCIICTLIRI